MAGALSSWWRDPTRPANAVLGVGALTAVAAGALLGVLASQSDGEAGPATEISLASSDVTTTTTEQPAPTTTRPPPATTPPAPSRAGNESKDQWIAVLASVEASASAADADARHAAIQARVPDARRLDSSQWPSLRPGYRVSYKGPFVSGADVLAFCGSLGLPVPDQCYGRFLSDNPADQARIADG